MGKTRGDSTVNNENGVLGFFYVCAFVGALFLALLGCHNSMYSLNMYQAVLALFEPINLLICIWEIAMHVYHAKVIHEDKLNKSTLAFGQLPKSLILCRKISLSEALSLKSWTSIWSAYAVIDPAYADQGSFGFWIDSGNGFTTIIPTILFAIGMTFDVLSPTMFGIIGIVFHYQEFYGTVVYFWQYCYQQRYKGQPIANNALVIGSNGLWLICPALAMYCSYVVIETQSFSIFR